MAITIKPCPFCGGKAEIDDPEAHKRGVGYRIECQRCNVSMWSFAGEKPETLTARWNMPERGKITASCLCGATWTVESHPTTAARFDQWMRQEHSGDGHGLTTRARARTVRRRAEAKADGWVE